MEDGGLVFLSVAIGLVCGVVCSSIARSKNRDALGYFLLGFFFGIIGLLITALIPKKETRSRVIPPFQPYAHASPIEPAYQPQERYCGRCPQCSFPLSPEFKLCPNCGLILKDSSAQTQVVSKKPGKCPVCERGLPPGENRCDYCGSQVVERGFEADISHKATVKRNITIGGERAFFAGEIVEIEEISPDEKRPQYKYVVLSKRLNKRFRLSEDDLLF